MSNLVELAKAYATKCHNDTNCTYGDQPYTVHLERVVGVAERFIHLVPEEMRESVIASCWGHDVIEDTRQTYNDVKEILGEEAADIIYAVTNEMGKNRKERAKKTYPKIYASRWATFVKMADRMANTEASKENGHGMYRKYRNEYAEFSAELYKPWDKFDEMWAALDELNDYVPTTPLNL